MKQTYKLRNTINKQFDVAERCGREMNTPQLWADLCSHLVHSLLIGRLIFNSSLMFHAFNNFELEIVQCRTYFTRNLNLWKPSQK